MRKIFFGFTTLFSIAVSHAQVKLPALITDSMILQRDEKIRLWGWASANEKVGIQFNGKRYSTRADSNGNWSVYLPPTKAGGPYTMNITASNKITLKEILFGDVWFCSGQSNMVHQLDIHDVTYAEEIRQANYPQIRQFLVPMKASVNGPEKDLSSGSWRPAVGESVRPFSAVAYFFAKKIHETFNIPVGIINSSVGGTPIEAWTSEEGLKAFPEVVSTINKNKDTASVNSSGRSAPVNRQPPVDAGMTGTAKWFEPNYEPKGWRNINIPGYWEDQGLKDLNGIVWYRREIDIPASMEGKPAKVFLGRIVDADELYINGKQVGRTSYQYPQRRYNVPAGLLKAGKNLFVIRVTNNMGKGGFVPHKPYSVFAGNDTVDLKGYWQYKVGAAFRPVSFAGGAPNPANQPTALYNGMVAPLINYNIKGICWYQGESNAGQPKQYAQLLKALLEDWRSNWSNDTLPFLNVQLPGFMDYSYLPGESNWALMREAQLKLLAEPNTALAVAIDLGEWNDIHPDNKKDVGERLALGALKLVYKQNVVHSGPVFKSATIDGNRVTISFTNTGGGLTTSDGEAPGDIAIAGADKKFVWAQTRIEGDQLVVWSDEVKEPKFVRYAWADNPANANLTNKEKLPASPFRTDN